MHMVEMTRVSTTCILASCAFGNPFGTLRPGRGGHGYKAGRRCVNTPALAWEASPMHQHTIRQPASGGPYPLGRETPTNVERPGGALGHVEHVLKDDQRADLWQ
jgi:hypothetical protein